MIPVKELVRIEFGNAQILTLDILSVKNKNYNDLLKKRDNYNKLISY